MREGGSGLYGSMAGYNSGRDSQEGSVGDMGFDAEEGDDLAMSVSNSHPIPELSEDAYRLSLRSPPVSPPSMVPISHPITIPSLPSQNGSPTSATLPLVLRTPLASSSRRIVGPNLRPSSARLNIRSLLQRRRHQGRIEYLVAFDGSFVPQWESEHRLPVHLCQEFDLNHPESRAPVSYTSNPARPRGRPRSRSQEF